MQTGTYLNEEISHHFLFFETGISTEKLKYFNVGRTSAAGIIHRQKP